MRKLRSAVVVCILLITGGFGSSFAADMEALAPVTDKDRCPVCGMFVAKYQSWLAQIKLSDGSVAMFDGPKDMLAYYFSPGDFGAKADAKVTDIRVRDYYSQKLIDGTTATYVTGSDVLGPMGHEFVPFAGREAAENFLNDHKGEAILGFSDITLELVQAMRKGHKMKGHMKK